MLTRLHHVGLNVGSIPAVVEVLEELGLRSLGEQVHSEVGLRIAHLQGWGVDVEVMQVVGAHSPAAGDPLGCHHLAFEARHVVQLFEKLREDPRIDMVAPPRRGAHGRNVLLFRLRDEPSVLLELVEAVGE